MRNRALDTNIVIEIWHGRWPGGRKVRTEETALSEPRKWLRHHPNDGILTPVRLEFLGGTRDKDEFRLADLFLGGFDNLDGGSVLAEDWREAEKIARRVIREGRHRDAVD
jgi:hypothetical protein